MKKIILKTNEDYFKFLDMYKEQIKIYSLTFTKTRLIRLFYDIM